MNIYFAGSIRGGRNDKEKYQMIIEELKKYGTVLTEHIGLDTLSEKGQVEFTEKRIYTQDTAWIRESDIIVADVTQPSLGVGYELGYAESLDKRIVCLFDITSGKSLSAMVRGNQSFEVFDYTDMNDIKNVVATIFES